MSFILQNIADAFIVTLDDLYKPPKTFATPSEQLRNENRLLFLCLAGLIVLLLSRLMT